MSIFINSKKTYEFVNPESGQRLQIPAQYIGSVPEWVTRLWLFRAAVHDTSITYVGNQSVQQEDDALLALRERAKELGIPRAGTYGEEKLHALIAEAEQKNESEPPASGGET